MLMIYGKKRAGEVFLPFSLHKQVFFYSTTEAPSYKEELHGRLKTVVAELNDLNKDFIFEIRKAGKKCL